MVVKKFKKNLSEKDKYYLRSLDLNFLLKIGELTKNNKNPERIVTIPKIENARSI